MDTIELYLTVGLIFILAGTVKGVVGFGLPLVSITLLTPLYGLVDAIGLMLIPAIVTNFWQAITGDKFIVLWRRLWTLFVAGALCALLAANILVRVDTRGFTILLGMIILAYSVIGLSSWQLPEPGRQEKWLSPITGMLTGTLVGLTGVSVFPMTSYLHALRLDRQTQFQAMGMWFLAVMFVISAVFGWQGGFPEAIVGLGVTGTLAGLVGMMLGQLIGKHLSESVFQQVFFVTLGVLGVFVAMRAYWA